MMRRPPSTLVRRAPGVRNEPGDFLSQDTLRPVPSPYVGMYVGMGYRHFLYGRGYVMGDRGSMLVH